MNEIWKTVTVTEIALAVHVLPYSGKSVHKDRPLHGLVLNDEKSDKEYIFSDGRVLRTEPGSLFYLPKHSSYTVKDIVVGGCYAINFEAEIDCPPFAISARGEGLARAFRCACSAWQLGRPTYRTAAMCALYEAAGLIVADGERAYMPSKMLEKLRPAMEELEKRLVDPTLDVTRLSALCGMSEVYFRRLFSAAYGVSPKEYIIEKRITYAKLLLSSRQYSVQSVAEQCGYSDPCYFSREFHRRTGVSPGRYVAE